MTVIYRRRKMRAATIANSPLAKLLLVAKRQISSHRSAIASISGLGGGISQVLQPSPPSCRFNIATFRWRRLKRSSRWHAYPRP